MSTLRAELLVLLGYPFTYVAEPEILYHLSVLAFQNRIYTFEHSYLCVCVCVLHYVRTKDYLEKVN